MSQLTSCHPSPSRSHPPTNTQYCSVTPDSTHKHFWCCDIVISCITWMPKNGECRHAILQCALFNLQCWSMGDGSLYTVQCTVIAVIMQRPLMKSVAYLRKNRSCVLWDFFLVFVLLKSFKFGSLLMSRKKRLFDLQKLTHICQFCGRNF